MINRIIEYSATNRGLVIILVLSLVVIGVWSIRNIPLDAIPDLSDPQVIIYTEWPGRSPDLVEAQITYPIVSAMLAAPRVSVVRGGSDYGFSYVYVIFDEGTDIYWGRSRVLEYLNKITGKLPEGVAPTLGPDATGVGWAFEYALVDKSGKHNLAQLRSFNDWYLRYWLESVPGVAEVATVGGFVKQYQVNVDPNKLLAYNLPLHKVMEVIRNSNKEVGGRVVEFTGKEYLVRGRGYVQSLEDIENLAVSSNEMGTPVLVKHVAKVELGPEMRRGAAELNGEGEVTGGIVVVRYGQNVMDVIQRIKAKLNESEASLPEGVEVVTTYDRSDLIQRSIDTLTHTLIEELIIVSVVILIFLWHFPSAIIPIITIPIAVILSFIPMQAIGVTVEHHVTGWNRHRHRRDGRCRHCGRRADSQEAGAMGGARAPRQFDPRGHRRRQGSRWPELLFAACDRGLVHAHLRPPVSGRATVQAPRFHEKLLNGYRGSTGHHLGPGTAAAVHANR